MLSAIKYWIYYLTSNNINTIANAEANATAFRNYTVNIQSQALSNATRHYFNVIVQDEVGNKIAYRT